MASGTNLPERFSYWRKSVQRNKPLAASVRDLILHKARYDPIRRRTGDTTACRMSLVGHSTPRTRKKTSSGRPGHVLASSPPAPWLKPRVRFLCIRTNFPIKCSAVCLGYVLVRARMCGSKSETTDILGFEGDATWRIWSTRTPANTC
jgi:hypothetical protein